MHLFPPFHDFFIVTIGPCSVSSSYIKPCSKIKQFLKNSNFPIFLLKPADRLHGIDKYMHWLVRQNHSNTAQHKMSTVLNPERNTTLEIRRLSSEGGERRGHTQIRHELLQPSSSAPVSERESKLANPLKDSFCKSRRNQWRFYWKNLP